VQAAFGAQAHMQFKLDGLSNAQRNVPTDASAVAQGRMAMAGATSKAKAAGAMAYRRGGIALEKARAMKNRWHNWLYARPDQQNFFLLITNVLYLALTLTALILTFLVVNEHLADFKRNEFTKHFETDPVTGAITAEQKQYPPCGMPTPDSMYLLQALGALPAYGWHGATLEPNYQDWMKKVDRALCARVVPGADYVPEYAEDLATCKDTSRQTQYHIPHAEELLALGYLLDDASITPDYTEVATNSNVDDKKDLFEKRACLEKKDTDGNKPFYPEQQLDAYGDLKTRVARAYLAAMPAFARYNNNRATCAAPAELKDPFDHMCKHSCHVRVELEAAAAEQAAMYDTGASIATDTTFTKQLYRLLALSLAGYHDRLDNAGECFKNNLLADPTDPLGEKASAYDFCVDSMTMGGSADTTVANSEAAVANFATQNTAIVSTEQCGDVAGNPDYPPPSPAPPNSRNEMETGDDKLAGRVCAATLQYGLFEQGRLFGLPDIIHPFVIDTRVDRKLHFVGKWVYNAMYVNPVKLAGNILADPKSRLELYIAYRLSSTTIWAILVANVAGYMMVRALAPTIVHILKMLGFTTNVVQYKSPDGSRPDVYKPIVLVRPKLGWPVYLAMGVTVLAIYWILYIDPATQSHYYISPTCEDWHGLGVQVPSGAFDTTWGKRRYSRFGENIIGVLLAITLVLMLFIIAVGKTFVPAGAKKAASTVSMGTTARLDAVALIMIAFALVVQILYIAQSWISGDAWYQAIKASDNDRAALETFCKDAIMSVWAAFWTSTSIAWFRQKWAVGNLNFLIQIVWMVCCLLLLWMPVLQSSVLLADEIEVAFSDGKGTSDTDRLIVFILILSFSAIWTVVLGIRLKAVWDAFPDRAASLRLGALKVAKAKMEKRQFLEGIEAAAAQEERDAQAREAFGEDGLTFAPASRFKFDLSDLPVGPQGGVPLIAVGNRGERKLGMAYMPLMPKQ
tara:strand:+ start:10563 stop:13466 length:2904 start_codon:yes stop_codon:yes gene_type:complete